MNKCRNLSTEFSRKIWLVKVVNWGKRTKFQSINLILFMDFPSNLKSFSDTVEKINWDFSPDRNRSVSTMLTSRGWKNIWHWSRRILPKPEKNLKYWDEYGKTHKRGYEFIGMVISAKPDTNYRSRWERKKLYRNFQGYSTNAGADLYAFGITSISQLKNIYAQNYKQKRILHCAW